MKQLICISTMAYSVNNDTEDRSNSTNSTSENDVLIQFIALQIPLPEPEDPGWESTPSANELEEALQFGLQKLADRDTAEKMGPRLQQDTPSYRHQMAVRTGAMAARLSRSGYVLDTATRYLVKRKYVKHNGTDKHLGRGPSVEADWMPEEACVDKTSTPCIPTPYRTADGSCNNPLHPHLWGVAMRPFRRTLPPDYADGISAPRGAIGRPLPSARDISVLVHRPMYHDDPAFTVMLAVWGQFIDHDITATALSVSSDGGAISCCGSEAIHPDCFPVLVDVNDPYFHQFNLTCMEFVRSAPAPVCNLGPREQLNQASAFLDGSVIYGPNLNLTTQLRSFKGGQLSMSVTSDGRMLLPYSSDPSDGCNQKVENARGRYCFASGDARANENLHLTTMHLLWARQHNRLAENLIALNPLWSDEKVFQESRRIVVAQLQHITYNEFLPVLLGEDLMNHLELNVNFSGYFYGYEATIDPSVANSFASAAFRFAHTLLPGLMKMIRNDSEEYVELHRMLFNPYTLFSPDGLDATLRGALATNVEKVNPYFTTELTEHLFEKRGAPPCGLDLVSLNIQRGRDHGLPPYPAWREKCGLSRPKSFKDMTSYVDNYTVKKLSELFVTVDDVDLYTGAIAEGPIRGGFLGPTITCLLADQFTRLKRGDRYWYETPEEPQAFTPQQLTELRKTTLARIICDNADAVDTIQTWVMRSVGQNNGRISCQSIPTPDLSEWKEPGRVKLSSLTTNLHVVATQLRGNVTYGRIWSNTSSVLWTGKPPIPIYADTTLRPQWNGEIHDSVFEGAFSQYREGQWLNGMFSFQFSLEWNMMNTLGISGTFTSPIYFKEVKGEVPSSTIDIPRLHAGLSNNPSVEDKSELATAQIVLEGFYSKDRRIFWWNGGFVFTVPSTYHSNNILSKYHRKVDSESRSSNPTTGNSLMSNPEEKQISNSSNYHYTNGQMLGKLSLNIPISYLSENIIYDAWDNQSLNSYPSSKASLHNTLVEVVTETSVPFNRTTDVDNVTWTEVKGSIVSGGMTSVEGPLMWETLLFPLSFQLQSPSVLQWNGSMTITTASTATVQGIVGDHYFLFNLNVTEPLVPMSGVFETPINVAELESLSIPRTIKTTPVDFSGLIKNKSISCNNCREVPITLLGRFIENGDRFLWVGNFILRIPLP
ncbi:hypothetical protein C0J52_20098 [Blattella germanica]|nr:hypothetical protein C0J52_20098 [Blattella germanica]